MSTPDNDCPINLFTIVFQEVRHINRLVSRSNELRKFVDIIIEKVMSFSLTPINGSANLVNMSLITHGLALFKQSYSQLNLLENYITSMQYDLVSVQNYIFSLLDISLQAETRLNIKVI